MLTPNQRTGRKPALVMPNYSVNRETAVIEEDELAFMDRPDSRSKIYDSSLSKPGRICSNVYCRSFVPGGIDNCLCCRSPLKVLPSLYT
jgi:hypothetical protein